MSKFQGIANRRRQPAGAKHADTSTVRTADNSATQIRVGRPRAKRSDPEYQQVTAYIRRDTYIGARKRLFDEDREFSELVEELVAAWLKG